MSALKNTVPNQAETNTVPVLKRLSSALWSDGPKAVEDFVGCEIDPGVSNRAVLDRIAQAFNRMPEATLSKYLQKYGIQVIA